MNEPDLYANGRYGQQASSANTIGRYTAKTFVWMFLGLLVTFGVSVLTYTSPLLELIITNNVLLFALLIIELVVVVVLVARIERLSVPVARLLFFVYAALTGVVFSSYFVLFQASSLVLVFAVTALYFGGLALFGYFTNADLSRLRPILVGGLIFLVIFGIVSMFIPSLGMMDRVVCLIGIAIFLGFTAYDTQKIKAYHATYAGNSDMLSKASIYCALQLYLDFVNLFLYLLRFLGKRRS